MDKIFFAFKYLKYNRLKKNAHGIHSPFVFELYNHVINNKAHYYAYPLLDAIRNELLKDQRMISIKDLGAGSGFGLRDKRKVKQIAKTSAKSPKFARLLFRLADHFQPKTILEIGTSLGISTMHLAIAQAKSKVITLEGCPETRKIALENFEKAGLDNIISREGNFDTLLPNILSGISVVDFVFFDGNHRKEPTVAYFNMCLEKAGNESVFIFDDIYWSKEMADAWEIIKSHPRVTVSLDFFQLGIVFFRKEQAKEHFILSY